MRRAILGAAVLATVASTPALATPSSDEPQRAAVSQVAMVKLLNAARAEHGLKPLRFDRKLARAAISHSRDMVANRYFAHNSPSGSRFTKRIAKTGWMSGRKRWHVGETLAWGAGANAAPAAVVKAWLASPPHRHIVLSPRFGRVGPGVTPGTPFGGGGSGRTFTADFGS